MDVHIQIGDKHYHYISHAGDLAPVFETLREETVFVYEDGAWVDWGSGTSVRLALRDNRLFATPEEFVAWCGEHIKDPDASVHVYAASKDYLSPKDHSGIFYTRQTALSREAQRFLGVAEQALQRGVREVRMPSVFWRALLRVWPWPTISPNTPRTRGLSGVPAWAEDMSDLNFAGRFHSLRVYYDESVSSPTFLDPETLPPSFDPGSSHD